MPQASTCVNNVAYYHTSSSYYSLQNFHQRGKMRGAQRVVAFCLLTAVLPTILLIIPLYLRHNIYADVTFAVAESDVVEIVDGVSSIFCQEHRLKMNSSFHAFQVSGKPQLSDTRKHIRLKKSMSLPDDTLEYWGFYLLKGSTVALSVCSRYDGSRILVVKGERNLRTCGLMDHSVKPLAAHMADGQGQVRVTFESHAQEVHPETTPGVQDTVHIKQLDPLQGQRDTSVKSTAHNPKEVINQSLKLSDNGENPVNILNEQYEGEILTNLDEDTNDDTFQNITTELHQMASANTLLGIGNQGNKPLSFNLTKGRNRRKRMHIRNQLRVTNTSISSNDDKNVSASRSTENNLRTKLLQESLQEPVADINRTTVPSRVKRRSGYLPVSHILDGGIEHGHGGPGGNDTLLDTAESSVSSFENSLLTCYDGQILLVQGFPPSQNCTSVHDVDKHHIMKTTHEVVSDGYYYYIFYSDNDVIENDIHAVFNIHKTTYQYTNYISGCINKTECTFPLSFWSDETVILEVPTRDGIEHEDDDITFLVSSCYPRTSVYIIFPTLVLFLILGCAFL